MAFEIEYGKDALPCSSVSASGAKHTCFNLRQPLFFSFSSCSFAKAPNLSFVSSSSTPETLSRRRMSPVVMALVIEGLLPPAAALACFSLSSSSVSLFSSLSSATETCLENCLESTLLTETCLPKQGGAETCLESNAPCSCRDSNCEASPSTLWRRTLRASSVDDRFDVVDDRLSIRGTAWSENRRFLGFPSSLF